MLKRLRWQLALLYALAALGLVATITVGSYALLQYYFQYTTDLALQYKMADAFQQYGLPTPPELSDAQDNWWAASAIHDPGNLPRPTPTSRSGEEGEEQEDEDEHEGEEDHDEAQESENTGEDERKEEPYDGQLASVFILPLSTSGADFSPSTINPLPFQPDQAAYRAAVQNGQDWRTVQLPSGSRLRLFTYRTGSHEGPAAFQVGRLLGDQDRVLGLFLVGLFLLGAAVFVFLSLGGWLLSGRTMGPAQKAWDQQQAFVSNASHELRTPLTILRATAELHLRLPGEVDASEGFRSVIDECDYMNRLVDDLLLLSRLDSRRLVLARQPILLADFLREVQNQMAPLAQEKGLSLALGKTEGEIWGDPVHMRQVLLILVDNALRYTPAGGTVQIESHQHGKQVLIAVVDNGIGVPTAHLPHLFERFYQVPRKEEGETKSNGLGLSIAKGLVEAQGGKIQLQSQEGKGMRVLLTFMGA